MRNYHMHDFKTDCKNPIGHYTEEYSATTRCSVAESGDNRIDYENISICSRNFWKKIKLIHLKIAQ